MDEGRGERERTSTNQEEKEIYGIVIYEGKTLLVILKKNNESPIEDMYLN